MGCRHAQSLLSEGVGELLVVEPSDEQFEMGLSRIGASSEQLTRFSHIEEIEQAVELCVVATSSQPRYGIVESLLKRDVPNLLVEKIVFQSEEQFDSVLQQIKAKSVRAHCNFVNRCFSNYREIRNSLEERPPAAFQMTVQGGPFGLGCNAIHYVDLFEYLTGSQLKIRFAQLQETTEPSRRGSQYRELTGALSGDNSRDARFCLISDTGQDVGVRIHLRLDYGQGETEEHFLNELTQDHVFVTQKGITKRLFDIQPTSRLTAGIVTDILAKRSQLTTIEETRAPHLELFRHFNEAFGIANERGSLCPIT